jgi:hypothetical protein
VSQRIRDNPFYVLGLGPGASRAEIEREGQKLLAMLELGLAAAASYPTPLGPGERTPELVRTALAELRDPQRRLAHESWARLPAEPVVELGQEEAEELLAEPDPWPPALAAFGWRRRAS